MQTKGTPMYGDLTLDDLAREVNPHGCLGDREARVAAWNVAQLLMQKFGITHADKELALYQILPKVDTGE